MALDSVTISLSGHVTETQKDLYNITFRMVCTDDDSAMPGLDTTHAIKYRPGDTVGDAVAKITAVFQERIDSYGSAAAIEGHPSMATAITAIENGLVI